MNKLKYKLQCFMMGRYGIDELYHFLFIFYTILLVLNLFIHSAGISIALWIILFYALFRILSKDIVARQKENAKFLILKNKLSKKIRQFKTRIKDTDHIYKKCPHCKATLRFPRKRGTHDAICPKCKKGLKVTVLYERKR